LDADLENADLSGAKYDNKTVWPENFDPGAAGTVYLNDNDDGVATAIDYGEIFR
jgi:hypothetical protein